MPLVTSVGAEFPVTKSTALPFSLHRDTTIGIADVTRYLTVMFFVVWFQTSLAKLGVTEKGTYL